MCKTIRNLNLSQYHDRLKSKHELERKLTIDCIQILENVLATKY